MSNNELTGEPAIYAAVVTTAVQFVAAFWLPWPDTTVAAVNAAVIAAAGVWVAFSTRSTDNGGSVKAALLGFVHAAVSAGMAFGWQVSPEQNAVIMSLVGALVAAFIRQTSKPAGRSIVSAVR